MGREPLVWRARDIEWKIGRPLVMGILNATPDSFRDGGRFFEEDAAIGRGLAIAEEGADILDVGGESTRPGARPVPAEEEWRRIGGVIRGVHGKSDIPISVDTYKPEVARKAIRAGAVIVNDVRGLGDPEMVRVVGKARAGAVIVHMKGEPSTMNVAPVYMDVVADVRTFLGDRLAGAVRGGVAPEGAVLDPGFGFGKTPAHNTTLLERLGEIRALGRPVLVGASGKRFAASVAGGGLPTASDGSLDTGALAIRNGADVIRVHDVAGTVRIVRAM